MWKTFNLHLGIDWSEKMVMVFKRLVSPEANDKWWRPYQNFDFFCPLKSEKNNFVTFACLICLFASLPLYLHVTTSLPPWHYVQALINILKQFPSPSILVKIINVEEFLISRNYNLWWKSVMCLKFVLKEASLQWKIMIVFMMW